ncbi:MAG: TonB-dependent receptor plug domain-containing protein [Glaciimonas sp.]|nr:TonB-dependent receptor plug domain-containing protein [Glaciimonas sp.]
MMLAKNPIALAVTFTLSSMWQTAIAQSNPTPEPPQAPVMKAVIVNASAIKIVEPNNSNLDAAILAPMRAASSDTARLLRDIPGLSLYGAGGVSSLPAIHGMADDRIRIKVDGMDLISACANHMNSPLSYIDPTNVGSIKVFAGITPVSAGGDSIGGTIQVNSAAPEFAKAGEGTLLKGQAGTFYRSNGNAKGVNLSATMANENLSVVYTGSTAEAGNYTAAKDFKPAAQSIGTRSFLAGDAVGSSSYKSENQAIAVALRHENHVLELKLGLQHIPYQGFPNQRMDMTGNDSEQVNLRYTGQYQWGTLEARVYNENTRHKMNFLEDKLTISNPKGMPMDTEGKNTGALLKADIALSARDTLRVGSEYQRYRLDDWWDPISAAPGMMGGGTFRNINNGRRDRFDVFGEWEAHWNPQWQSQLGIRSSSMTMNTGNVQGYNNMAGMMGYGNPANPASIPGAFNAADRKKTDHNIDLTALARYTPDAGRTFEAGFARKTRSPNLYERFAWSTNNNMVMNMINWFGDANGYVGNLDLKPEVANTISATASWHDAAQEKWALNVTPYYTHVENYIDAASCATAGKTCPTRTDGFVNLSFVNQTARLYGVDVSGYIPLAKNSNYGSFTATGMLNTVNGKNNSTGDKLYNIMPLNAKLAVVQRVGNWTNTIEGQFVDAKTNVSQVRNELKTAGYSLLNLRTSYEWKQVRLDIGVDNALNKLYASPLGGAYVGQRPMTYGVPVPGMGRSLYTALNVKF